LGRKDIKDIKKKLNFGEQRVILWK